MICYTCISSPIGTLTAVCADGFLTQLHLHPVTLPDHIIRQDDAPVLIAVRQWLDQYFAGKVPETDIPLRPQGTAFQQRVWNTLLQIPYGKMVTYGQIAAQLGNPRMSAQAVGQAVGKNPIAILIPCHRVLGAGRKLTGYAGGLDKKRYLLDLEQIEYK